MESLLIITIFILIGVTVFVFATRTSALHVYNVILANEKVAFQGTEIRGNEFCTEIILNNRVDTRICQPHLITEAAPAAAEASPAVTKEAHK